MVKALKKLYRLWVHLAKTEWSHDVVKALKKLYRLWVHLAKTEWSHDRNGRIMAELAKEYAEQHKDKLDANSDSDILIEVWEHGGWWLAFNRAGLCVGSANDAAEQSLDVKRWWDRWRSAEEVYLGTVRREPQ